MTSLLWNYYEKNPEKKATARCVLCSNEYSFKTTTSNLKKHLMYKHATAYYNVLNHVPDEKDEQNNSHDSDEQKTPSITKMPSSSRKPIKQKKSETIIKKPIREFRKILNQNQDQDENEFDLFCRSLAVQLKKMPLNRALVCQEKLQSVMVQERLSHICPPSPPQAEFVYLETETRTPSPELT